VTFFLVCQETLAPHTGQSSQLFLDANDGNAQFLPRLAGAVVWTYKAQELQKSREVAHRGQSSQLPFDANDSAEVNRPKDQAKEEAWKAHPEILA
jgi:hypothetical protein